MIALGAMSSFALTVNLFVFGVISSLKLREQTSYKRSNMTVFFDAGAAGVGRLELGTLKGICKNVK